MKEKDILKIGITGPESTGKTALAETLAASLDTAWVPEFARYYVAHLGRQYERRDLHLIGLGQKSWEEWYTRQVAAASGNPVLILDTDWTVLQIWEQYRFQNEPGFEWQKGYGKADNADLYLLCTPDFSWQPDPLREHPEARDILFRLYQNLLRQHGARFITLTGNHETRTQTALAAIRELL